MTLSHKHGLFWRIRSGRGVDYTPVIDGQSAADACDLLGIGWVSRIDEIEGLGVCWGGIWSVSALSSTQFSEMIVAISATPCEG